MGVPRATDGPYWDPYDVELDTDPHPAWKRLRDEEPVYWNNRFGFFALSRHADVEAAHRMPRELSSAYGTVLEIMTTPGDERSAGTKRLIVLDPPEHDRLRALVSRAFTVRRIAQLEPEVRRICADLLDARVGAGGFDYLGEFGSIIPSEVISALLGVPGADRAGVRDLIDRVFHIEPGVGMINETSMAASGALLGYLGDQLEERRRSPRDDMMTALVHATIDEDGETRGLTSEEALGFANLLLAAGTETTARLLGWAVVLLDQHPHQREVLARDPGAVPGAIDEVLRYEAPSAVQGRTATKDLEIQDTKIPAGSKVLLLTGSAGRDERAYPDADRFDIGRSAAHLSFGHGVHYCIGAALARLEARVALEETLKRFPSWLVDYDRAERIHTSTVRGWSHVPITC
ncbi:MAG TPA: cytochrome P450 [Acidimicrobiales bacterium]|jgi:cytochrome P450|nr:cytochrome P450 [Acidimicrobiales bacterium]